MQKANNSDVRNFDCKDDADDESGHAAGGDNDDDDDDKGNKDNDSLPYRALK